MVLEDGCPGERSEREEPSSLWQDYPVRVQRSKSVVPPSIVELTGTRAVLSWRIARGACSIRTEVEAQPNDSQEWSTLDQDLVGARHHRRVRKKTAVSSRVRVVEVDHVELQACGCGCPQCIRGEESACVEDEPAAGCSCPSCTPARGVLGCWRPVYQGPDCQCHVTLKPGNALHHFRLLVRARRPPQEKRSYMRPTRREQNIGTTRMGKAEFDVRPPQRLSSYQRRHQELHQPGTPSDGTHSGGTEGYGDADGPGPHGVLATPKECNAPLSRERVSWYVSAPVFVDSRPPAVTLYGIGTALVMTWPPLSRFSGSERVSYILEQWSPPTSPMAAKRSTVQVSSPAPAHTSGGGEQKTRDHRRRHHQQHQHPSRPKQSCAKQAFSVGKRCWFVPTSLQAGRRYWYRLRIIHEGGRSVGGPWVSHFTSLSPPSCVGVGASGLIISLPRLSDGCLLESAKALQGGNPDGQPRGNSADAKERNRFSEQFRQSSSAADDTEIIAREQGQGGYPREASMETIAGEKEQRVIRPAGGVGRGCAGETPVVWYTLEGLEAGSQWLVLYRGPDPEVVVEELQGNSLITFRVGVDVDMTELRRRALAPLRSIELEQPPAPLSGLSPSYDNTLPAVTEPRADYAETNASPSSLRQRGAQLEFIRPALRLNTGTSATLCVAPVSDLELRTWNAADSPAMLQMKREGFKVYDAATTVEGGFYLESPSLPSPGWAQGSCGTVDMENNGLLSRRECRDYSDNAVFATAPRAPRFAAFVVDGIQEAKLWWTQPRSKFDPSASKTRISAAAETGDDVIPRKQLAPAESMVLPSQRQNHMLYLDDEGETLSQYPSFALDVLDPVTGAMQLVHCGPESWADLGRSMPTGVPLAPATAYFVRLSARISAAQPDSGVDGVVMTAPPAPVLELVGGGAQGNNEGGAATLKAFWTAGIHTHLLPGGENPTPFSVALEMAYAWENGSPAHGVGGTVKPSCRVASGRAAVASPTGFAAVAGGGRDRNGSLAVGEEEVVVRKDAGGGQCWTLDSSSWGKPGCAAGKFQVVWAGVDGEAEAFTPPLPPGMRFAFRVRVECCFGVAVSAATVYQTAPMIPLTPKGLRAGWTTHESRVGKTSSCVRLSWGPSHTGHRGNVITSFTVQVRRSPSRSGDGVRSKDDHLAGQLWRNVCSCPDTACVDPETLGVTRILADYRVRAEGPGGLGPWSQPLRVDLIGDPLCEGARDGIVDGVDDEKRGRPMAFARAGTRERDALTGEVRRPWTKRRSLTMSPASPAVAATASPGTEATAAATAKAMDHLHNRAGGNTGKQIMWEALASPRAAHRCHTAASPAPVTGTCWVPTVCGCKIDDEGGRQNGGMNAGDPVHGRKMPPEESLRRSPTERIDVRVVVAEVPHELVLLPQDEMDISSNFTCGVTSLRSGKRRWWRWTDDDVDVAGGDEDRKGRYGNQTRTQPVVTWNSQIRPQSTREVRQHRRKIRRRRERNADWRRRGMASPPQHQSEHNNRHPRRPGTGGGTRRRRKWAEGSSDWRPKGRQREVSCGNNATKGGHPSPGRAEGILLVDDEVEG